MADDRRMTTDRFYGGVSSRLENLRALLRYVDEEGPTRDELTDWVIANTRAGSKDAVSHHLTFLDSIRIIELSDTRCELDEYGSRYLQDNDPETLYEALNAGVKGFDVLLSELAERPMTDEDIMDLLVSEFEEAEMKTPGPAARHREWLQVLGFVEREDGVNRITEKGRKLIGAANTDTELTPEDISVGDYLSQEEIEEAFDTGFGYQISGINPRRDDQDRRYVLVFANEDGPYDDSVTQGEFAYIGEGLRGDQSESSPGNSTLIDAVSTDIPVHFFYKDSKYDGWEYQGLIDVLDYEFEERDGRQVLVFQMQHLHQEDDSDPETEVEVQREKTRLEQALDSEPQLTSDEEQFTETRRRVRDRAFAELVKEAYDYTCAMCGSSRETPDGNPEVEAAHIYPKEYGGSDDVRNGLALCKLHHWAFDSGWLSISDEYEVLVKDAPDRQGYYEFKQLENDPLELPENEKAKPNQKFIKKHRELSGVYSN
jgi:putative restriction endonuclease